MGDAVVLAGGKAPRELAKQTPYEACLTAGGEPMVLRVVRAILGAPSIERVFVLGKTDILSRIAFPERVTIAEGADDIRDVLRRAIKLPRIDEPFLLASADIPLLKASAVEYFWQQAYRKRADLAYPIVRREQIMSFLPRIRRTYVHLADGIFTGGNLLYVGGGVSESLLDFAGCIFEARKRPWKLAALFGLRFWLSFILRRLSTCDIEQHLSGIWGRRCRALIVPYPEIALDVDKLSDHHIIDQYISETTR